MQNHNAWLIVHLKAVLHFPCVVTLKSDACLKIAGLQLAAAGKEKMAAKPGRDGSRGRDGSLPCLLRSHGHSHSHRPMHGCGRGSSQLPPLPHMPRAGGSRT
jgi:hypothetical protein